MTTDDARLHELRRLAFGRTSTPEDEARADAARRELEIAMAPPVAEPETATGTAPQLEPEPVAELPRRTWILPALIALTVGMLVGAGATTLIRPAAVVPISAPTATFTPGASGLPPEVVPLSADQPVVGSPGDVAEALAWFDGEQQPEDETDESDNSGLGVVASTTRLVYSSQNDKVWIAQTAAGQLCIIQRAAAGGTSMCVTPEEFVATGIPLHAKGSLSVVWNGTRMLISTGADQLQDVRP